jgi:hypothetical protein
MKDRLGIALGEASTWRGLVMILTAIGIQLDPEQQAAIISLGLSIGGILALFFKRKS